MGTLYENIVHLCELNGIKGGKMCVDLGISKSLLSDLKAGRKKTINIATAEKIAEYFDVPVGALLDITNMDQARVLADYDFMLRYKKLPMNERFQIDNLIDLSAEHPDRAPGVLEDAVYGFADTKKAPSEDGVTEEQIKFALAGDAGRVLTDEDMEKIRAFAAFTAQERGKK